MKQSILILIIAAFFVACGGGDANAPQDLAEKKALLVKKQSEFDALKAEINALKADIEKEEPPKEKSRRLVTTTTAERTDFDHYVSIQGSVQSDEYVYASSEMGGRILKMNLKEGQSVRKGQLVATIDMEVVDKQIAEIEKSLELAVDIYERQKRLWDQNIGSEMQFLQAKNNKERLEKSLETIKFQTTKANVYAPISGVVEMVNLKSGEMAAPGLPIVQLLNTNKVKVVASVPENYLASIRKGEEVTIKLPALNEEKTARVSRIGSTVNPSNRTFEVEVNLSNPKGIYKPNLLAEMLINDKSESDVVVVPVELVQQDVSGKSYVVLAKEGAEGLAAEKVFVQTGDSYNNQIVVTEGLKGGETLVAEGARGLAQGELLKLGE